MVDLKRLMEAGGSYSLFYSREGVTDFEYIIIKIFFKKILINNDTLFILIFLYLD